MLFTVTERAEMRLIDLMKTSQTKKQAGDTQPHRRLDPILAAAIQNHPFQIPLSQGKEMETNA